jgi:nucleoside-diphosphate kinase
LIRFVNPEAKRRSNPEDENYCTGLPRYARRDKMLHKFEHQPPATIHTIEFSLFFHYNYNIMTRCFTMLKPGVVNRRLVGEVIERLEKKGFKLVGLKMMQVSNELACSHYAEHKEKPFFGELVDYITSGPVVAMVWQADDCVALMRKMCGATKPSEAMPGTIRGDYCTHTSHNIIHASDSDESAAREIALWFNENELIDWDDCCGEKWY